MPDAPAELVEIIGLALRKDPKDRWQSMQVIHTVLGTQKQKYDSGVFQNSGLGQAAAMGAPGIGQSGVRMGTPAPPPPSSPPMPGADRPRRSGRKWMWIGIVIGAFFWAKSCGSSRDRTKIDTNIPGLSISVPGLPDGTVRTTRKGTLTNQSILDMLEAEVPETVIVSHIHASKTRFTLTTDEIIKLTKAGATPAVLDAMRHPTAEPPETPPAAEPAPEKRTK